MPEMITANRLSDGHVVYLDADGGWAEDFRNGLVLGDAAARETALERGQAAANANVVVDPYAIELEMRAGHLAPRTLRERIRAEGPTIGVASARG
jgi:hypothetical protein